MIAAATAIVYYDVIIPIDVCGISANLFLGQNVVPPFNWLRVMRCIYIYNQKLKEGKTSFRRLREKMGKERKIAIELSERSQSRMHKCSPMLSFRGTINFEFAILISIFFIAPKAMHSSARSFRFCKNGLRLMEHWIAQCALSISASFSLHYPYVSARIHSLLLPFSSSFNSLFYSLSPRTTVKSLRRSVFGAISSCNWRPFDPLTYSGESLGRCFCP